jgi:hypothetical protein
MLVALALFLAAIQALLFAGATLYCIVAAIRARAMQPEEQEWAAMRSLSWPAT